MARKAIQATIEMNSPIAEAATPLDIPKGKMELLRDAGYRTKLVAVLTATGNKSLDNGDAIAQSLRGATLEDAYAIAAETLKIEVADLKKKYGHLNPGQQRMNLGNRIRGAIARSNRA